MSKITFRLPSKVMQYGYAEVELTSEDLGWGPNGLDAEALGLLYVQWVANFQIGELNGKASLTGKPDAELIADTSLAEHNLKAQPMIPVMPEESDEDVENAAVRMIEQHLGSTTKLPWEGEIQTEPKPWEKKAGPVKVPTVKKNLF